MKTRKNYYSPNLVNRPVLFDGTTVPVMCTIVEVHHFCGGSTGVVVMPSGRRVEVQWDGPDRPWIVRHKAWRGK